MKKIILFTVLLFSSLTFSQKISILDEETRSPIPYAKLILKDKDYCKNTEENGQAQLENTEEISEIQSFGYENLKVEKYQTVYLLKPKFTEIEEVEISKPTFSENFKIGKIEKSSTFFGARTTMWSVGKEIKILNFPKKRLYVKSLKFSSRLNEKHSATIKVNFYYNENGLPGHIYKSMIITCFKNKKYTEYIVQKPFTFPKEGVIIGFEWIFNNENAYQKKTLIQGKTELVIAHEPLIGAINENSNNFITGSISNGDWVFTNVSSSSIGNIAIQLELTN